MRRVETLRRTPAAQPASVAWDAAAPATPDTPAAARLRIRRTLAQGETADAALIRWLAFPLPPKVLMARPDPAAVGLMLAAFREPFADPNSPPQSVECEALDPYGLRKPWPDSAKKRTLGPRRGSCFTVRGEGELVHVAEGSADALALHSRWGETAIGAGGTAALRDPSLIRMLRGADAVVWADPGARQPAAELARAVGADLVECRADPAEMHADGWPGFAEAEPEPPDRRAELKAEGWDADEIEAILASDSDSWAPCADIHEGEF